MNPTAPLVADDTGSREQPKILPPQTAALEALAHTRDMATAMHAAADKLLSIEQLKQEPPEMHTIVINPGNNGVYTVTNKSRFQAKSIGVLNPTSVNIYLGVGGASATPTSRAPAVAPQSFLVLPVQAGPLFEIGCDPAQLLTNTAVIYLFRYLTVQELAGGAII